MAEAYSIRRVSGRRPAAPSQRLGNWKLAYADFLTALCAFFLVMWIVHGVSSEDKAELARQFGAQTDVAAGSASTATPAVDALAHTLQTNSGLEPYGTSVRITGEGQNVRIDLTDMAVRPLFEKGDGALNATGEALVGLTARALAPLPWPIRIEGHTDSIPSQTPGYSNWELSAARANSARRILQEKGVNPDRFQGVTGLSHTKPLIADAPHLPANRRISIVVDLSRADTL